MKVVRGKRERGFFNVLWKDLNGHLVSQKLLRNYAFYQEAHYMKIPHWCPGSKTVFLMLFILDEWLLWQLTGI